jgi:hypothetical protein
MARRYKQQLLGQSLTLRVQRLLVNPSQSRTRHFKEMPSHTRGAAIASFLNSSRLHRAEWAASVDFAVFGN